MEQPQDQSVEALLQELKNTNSYLEKILKKLEAFENLEQDFQLLSDYLHQRF